MDDVLLALLSALGELLFEVFAQVLLEEVIALIVRSFQNVFVDSNPINPGLAALGHLLLGFALGAASVFVYPHPIFHPSRFHGVSLLTSPLVTGFVMLQLGTMLRRRGKHTARIESFSYGFTFALGWALVRFVGVR